MNRRLILLTIFSLLPAMAVAWGTREGDEPLSATALRAALVGQVLTFHDDGQSRFYGDGRYSYTYGQGGIAYGHYAINDDGTVCIGFINGARRCDLYVRNAARLVIITERGDRFPIRP